MSRRSKSFSHSDRIISRGKKAQTNRKKIMVPTTMSKAGWAIIEASDDRILGFTMIGAEAGEVMTVVQTAMLADLPYPKLRDAVIAHPTMAEGLGPLFSNVPAG